MPSPTYSAQYYAMKPTGVTRFLRTFVLWQFIRFIVINLRMTAMILKAHDSAVTKSDAHPVS